MVDDLQSLNAAPISLCASAALLARTDRHRLARFQSGQTCSQKHDLYAVRPRKSIVKGAESTWKPPVDLRIHNGRLS